MILKNLRSGVVSEMVDQDLVVLTALCLLGEKRKSIPSESVRHIRVIVSVFKEEVLSEEEYYQIIDTLSGKGYILKKGDEIEIERKGIALVHAVGERLLGQTAFYRLFKMINKYYRNNFGYIVKIGKILKALQKAKRSKIRKIDEFSIRVIGVIAEIKHKYSDLVSYEFRLDSELMKNVEVLDRQISYFRRGVARFAEYPVITKREGNILHVIGLTEINSIRIFGKELKFTRRKTVNREDISGWNSVLISAFLEKLLKEVGYIRSGGVSQNYVNYREFECSDSNVGILREHDALNLDFWELNDNRVFIWVETYKSIRKSVLDFINERFDKTISEKSLLNVLKDLKMRVVPSGRERKLKNILLNRDLTKELVPKTNQTYEEFWKARYGIELSQEIQPILIIEGEDEDLHYPAEMVYIDRYFLEKHFGEIRGRIPKAQDPRERVEKVKNLLNILNEVKKDYSEQRLEIDFQVYCPTVEELMNSGAFKEVIHIVQPLLEFFGEFISLDPMDIFEPHVQPLCGKKNLTISHLIVPNIVTEKEIDYFFDALHSMFSSYGFGTIRGSKNLKIIRYDPDSNVQELESKIQNLSKAENGKNFGIAILPDDGNTYRYSLKRLFPRKAGVPLLNVRLSTLQQILSNRFLGSKFLCLKILIKNLKEKESIWTLANSAGLSEEKTLFVGIGFSGYPRDRRVSKCAAVLHNSHGDRLSWRVLSTPQERTITKQWFDMLLNRIRDIVEREKPTRLLFYRTGTMYPAELDAIKRSFGECNWLANLKKSFVSILEGSNYRFYLSDGKEKNIPAGYGIIVNDREAFLSTSNYDERELKQGTIIPVRLKLEIGDDDIKDILKEYHDLTYLNWLAPQTTAKQPFIMKIADKFAELTREGVPTESMFYLDL